MINVPYLVIPVYTGMTTVQLPAVTNLPADGGGDGK